MNTRPQPISIRQRDALARFINTIRPDWRIHTIEDVLAQATRVVDDDLVHLTHAAVNYARTARNIEPAGIAKPGPHWDRCTAATHHHATAAGNRFCGTCRTNHPTGTGCPQPATDTASHAAAAREALRSTR